MIKISFHDLSNASDLTKEIGNAFGPDGLGILFVYDIPGYIEARKQLLNVGLKLAQLPQSSLDKLEDRVSNYNIGWSHGKEKIGGGKFDLLKGSFYANPIKDIPSDNVMLVDKYPDTLSPNIWPTDSLPELEPAFKRLGKIIVHVGKFIGKQCDNYIRHKLDMNIPPLIEAAVSSDTPKSR
jgi:hypothetical protein